MTSNGCGQPQRVMTMPTVLTVVAASLLVR